MSKPIVDDNFDSFPDRAEPIEDTFRHATEAQIHYIDILRSLLGFSIPTRSVKIAGIIGKSFSGDMYSLSTIQASQIINKFKEWKEQRS